MINPEQFLPQISFGPAVLIGGLILLFVIWYFYRKNLARPKKYARELALAYDIYTLEWPNLPSEHALAALCQFLLHWTKQFESPFKLSLEAWQNENQKIFALVVPHKAKLIVASLNQHFPDLTLRPIHKFQPLYLSGTQALWEINLAKKNPALALKKINNFFHYEQNGKYSPTKLTWQWLFDGENISGLENQASGQLRLILSHPDPVAGPTRLHEIKNSLKHFLRQNSWQAEFLEKTGATFWDDFFTRKIWAQKNSALDIPDLVELFWEI